MSRRRRFAVRQVAEPEMPSALSDVEDVAVAEPNFNLLGMMHVEEAAAAPDFPQTTSLPAATAPGSTQLYTDADGDEFMGDAPTQVIPSISQNGGDVVQPAKKARVEASSFVVSPRETTSTGASTALNGHARDVFQLYQTGLCDDHMLRLHFIRRKPPPPPESPVENEFVLPRPRLSLLEMLPPQMVTIRDIMCADDPAHASIYSESLGKGLPMDEIVHTVSSHWRELGSVDLADLAPTWRGLQESEWVQVYEASGLFVPTPNDLLRLLETLRSDGFAPFVWHRLLVPTVQAMCRDKAPRTVTQFTTALLSHEIFRRLPAKQFRAELRAKNLRGCCEDASFGAAVELEVITHFHKFRNTTV